MQILSEVISDQGEPVDMICARFYASVDGIGRYSSPPPGFVEKVLEANPGLAAHGPVLPMGGFGKAARYCL